MAFSQRARAYTLNPTLPCPTLPLSPRALSDSSKSQQRAGFALNPLLGSASILKELICKISQNSKQVSKSLS